MKLLFVFLFFVSVASAQEYLYEELDRFPAFEECEGDNIELRNCFNTKLGEIVGKYFNTDLAGLYGLTGKQKIEVQFIIDKEGYFTGITAKGSHPALEEEAIRIISRIPKILPGEKDGRGVGVSYLLPIIFKVEEDEEN